jgi:hypothetical protein
VKLLLLAVAIPVLFWPDRVDTAPRIRQAGLTHIAVPPDQSAQWKAIQGISADPVDLAATVKLQSPGVTLYIDDASASRRPWISSNGWQFMRQPKAKFYYDVPPETAPLAAAEAFCFGGDALIHTTVDGVKPLVQMLQFLTSINSDLARPIADIGFIDNGSAVSAEVMNLMVRDTLLFAITPAISSNYKVTVRLGSQEYPESSVKDADSIVRAIRTNLNDERRSVRIFGSSVVIARLTGEPDKLRLHLLNYGAGTHIRVGGFRVRVLGRYSKFQLHSFDSSGEQLLDYEVQPDATEFTVPELKTYAIVDLSRPQL